MALTIRSVQDAASSEWDSGWWQCEFATYFQSREWAEIWSVLTGGQSKPSPQVVAFSDGATALLPLSRQKGSKGEPAMFLSSPGGTFGGWLVQGKLSRSHIDLIMDYLEKKIGNLLWRLNPYDPASSEVHFPGLTHDATQALDLRKGFDAIHEKWRKGHILRQARQAQKAGVEIRLASQWDDWDAYYRAYQDSIRRWGERTSTIYPIKLFEELFRRHSAHIRLWVATHDGETISGALCFYSRYHVAYWHGASLKSHLHLRPVHLLMFEAIKHACENGYRWFDFNPSGKNEGVASFKKSFGPEQLPCPLLQMNRNERGLLKRVRSWLPSISRV